MDVSQWYVKGNVKVNKTSALLYSGFEGTDSRIIERYAIVNGELQRKKILMKLKLTWNLREKNKNYSAKHL